MPPPVPVELLLAAYMAEVRRNGEWAVTNVGTASDTYEIMYEVADAGVRAGILTDAHRSHEGWLTDDIFDACAEAGKIAIHICSLDGVTDEEAMPVL